MVATYKPSNDSIDRDLVKTLRATPPGSVDPLMAAEARGWLTEDDFIVPKALEEKMLETWQAEHDAYMKSKGKTWSEAEEAFGRACVMAYAETFNARKALQERMPKLKPPKKMDKEDLYVWASDEFNKIDTFTGLPSSVVTHNIFNHLQDHGIEGKHYTEEEAVKFIGAIARDVTRSFEIVTQIPVEVHPLAKGRTAFMIVNDIKGVPVTNKLATMSLLPQLEGKGEPGKQPAGTALS